LTFEKVDWTTSTAVLKTDGNLSDYNRIDLARSVLMATVAILDLLWNDLDIKRRSKLIENIYNRALAFNKIWPLDKSSKNFLSHKSSPMYPAIFAAQTIVNVHPNARSILEKLLYRINNNWPSFEKNNG